MRIPHDFERILKLYNVFYAVCYHVFSSLPCASLSTL
jgi:hypothetical protein